MGCGRIERDPLGQVVFALELWLNGITVGWFVSMMKSWQQLRNHAVGVANRARRARQASGPPDAEAAVDTDRYVFDVEKPPPTRPRTVVH